MIAIFVCKIIVWRMYIKSHLVENSPLSRIRSVKNPTWIGYLGRLLSMGLSWIMESETRSSTPKLTLYDAASSRAASSTLKKDNFFTNISFNSYSNCESELRYIYFRAVLYMCYLSAFKNGIMFLQTEFLHELILLSFYGLLFISDFLGIYFF